MFAVLLLSRSIFSASFALFRWHSLSVKCNNAPLDLAPILYQLHWITELLKRIYLTLWLSTLISPFLFSSFPSRASYRFATSNIFPPLYTVRRSRSMFQQMPPVLTSLVPSFSLPTVGCRKASGRCNVGDWGTGRNENFIGNKKV